MLRRKRFQQLAKIRVVGVGYGGITAVNSMLEADIAGVDYVTLDSSARDLEKSRAPHRVFAERQRGRESLKLPRRELQSAIKGSDMVFIVGGLGGSTSMELIPLVASVARSEGALTTAVVTTPFSFEGLVRMQQAEQAITVLRGDVNTLVVIPNDRLLSMSGGRVAFHQTYELAQRIWRQSVEGISELVNAPGLVNVDFADVRTIMSSGGPSVIAMGSASGPERARRAAGQATNSPFLDVTIDGARGVLFNISGGPEMTLDEVRQAATIIRRRADPDVNLIFGATIKEALQGQIRLTLIATGCGRKSREVWAKRPVVEPVTADAVGAEVPRLIHQ